MWEELSAINHKEVKMKKSKKYLEASKKIEKNKIYSKEEAIKLVKETSTTSFDASVELVLRLNIDTKKADQQLRGAIVLPNGTGKTKKVLVIAKGDAAKAAREAGADYVGDQDMLDKIAKENWFDFDVMIATPDMMPALGKLGRVLGPKGLMPNPKTGSVTMDTAKAVEDVKKGRVEYRADSYGNVAVIIGKVSFDETKLLENMNAFVSLMLKLKPSTVKGTYVKNISISSTMGPGIKVDTNNFDK
jgi:large subunit ribosomal protein L1